MIKDQEYLSEKANYCLDLAKKLGATDSSVVVSNSISEIMIWGLAAILIQIFCFKIVDILIKDLPKRIERGEISSSILLFSIKLGVALLNSAAIAG